jgi:DNA-3-methyladenine glycosylase II
MLILDTTDKRVLHLCSADKTLKKLIEIIQSVAWPLHDDYFVSLVQSIVSQQLSNKAAASIYRRLEALCGTVSPATITNFSEFELRNVGLSQSKARYISGLADSVLSHELEFDTLANMNDTEVVKHLTQVRGVGQWTAEMFLIFSLHRQNVLSFGDAGLQSTIRWLYETDEKNIKLLMTRLQAKWSPYNSVAALYLWEAVDKGLTRSNHNLDHK